MGRHSIGAHLYFSNYAQQPLFGGEGRNPKIIMSKITSTKPAAVGGRVRYGTLRSTEFYLKQVKQHRCNIKRFLGRRFKKAFP